MLIESYALYAVNILLVVVPNAVKSWVSYIFNPALGSIQVIVPYLVILRVANQRALTSDTISGTTGSIRFRSQVTTVGDGSLPDGDPMGSAEMKDEAPSELGARSEDVIQEVPL